MSERILSIDDARAALPVRKSRRWLVEFLGKHPTDAYGRPLFRLAGRDKLVYLDRLIEAFPSCPSKSSKAETKKRKTSTSAEPISASQWTEAAKLTGDPSLEDCVSGSKTTSNVVSMDEKRPRLKASRHS